MVTYQPFDELLAFYRHYKLANYPQITVARDPNFFFPVFFKVRNLPALYLYDKKGEFKQAFDGSVAVDSLTKVY